MILNQIVHGDALEVLRTWPDKVVQCCVTSPPYWGLRDYGVDKQLGLEQTPEEYVARMVEVFREVRRVLRDDGVLWLNLGDSYAGSWGNYHPNSPPGKHGQRVKETAQWNRQAYDDQLFLPPTANKHPVLKHKNLIGIPWRVAFAMQADGWWLRQDIIWHKPNPMPESVRDRCTKAHEYIFLLSKNDRYYYDAEAIKEKSITHDMRRPYGSPGANQLDARENPQGSGNLRSAPASYKGSKFNVGKTAEHQLGRSSNKVRVPAGWQTGKGSHGSYHEKGRAENVEYSEDIFDYRNKRSVWTISTKPFTGAHFAVFPPELIEPCILAGSKPNDIVLDPFMGSGTTAIVAHNLCRQWLGIELKYDYVEMVNNRIKRETSQMHLFQGIAK